VSKDLNLEFSLFCDITQPSVVIPYRRCAATYGFHFQGSRRPLKMGRIVCPATPVSSYYYTLRNIPAERISHLLRGESLKSRLNLTYCVVRNLCRVSMKIKIIYDMTSENSTNNYQPQRRHISEDFVKSLIILQNLNFALSYRLLGSHSFFRS